jgi:hypothetical protein
MKGEVAALFLYALKHHLLALCHPFYTSEEEVLYRFFCLPALILQSKSNCTTIDLIYPTLQGVDLIFDKG